MSLKGLVEETVVKLDPESTLIDAAKLMFEKHVGDVVIVSQENKGQGKPMGILTDRDIAMELARKGEVGKETKVREVMTANVIVGTMNDGVYETIRKMKENGIHRMPIVDTEEDQLVGLISVDDLLQLLGHEIQQLSQVINSERSREGLAESPSSASEEARPVQARA